MADWYTAADAATDWPDAPDDNEPYLTQLLDVARQAVLAYGPAIADDDDPPTNYRHAQLMVAQSTWTASAQNSSGDLDGNGWGVSIAIPALNSAVKQVIRPRSVFGGPVG